ncbi:hypothetical protein B0W47_17820 (plasmid) [Komagataeibacter nataicola]|uniref:Helix-turn-helix domain-containing protein n=1 Tax=Komagataeibacter nataicola TaxID=265960 RepID=A0A9N7CKC2_9PROT|nr:hypothetical protein B0W47_17725 [Komagataeibacter nataicola]AQU89405.1 hypothetical protein B0W47_17820 [Komagataeibacter nataicola]
MKSDLLYGLGSIGEFLGLTKKQVHHRAKNGQIPTFHMGRIICANANDLRAWLATAGHGGNYAEH